MPRHLHTTQRLDIATTGLRVAVIADTHSKPHSAALEQVQARKPDLILHANDIGNLQMLRDFEHVAPLITVHGNIDTRAEDLPDSVLLDGRTEAGAGLRILLTHIAVRGPRLTAPARRLATEHRADLVVLGHSHVPLYGRDGPFVLFNPGSIGPRRFRLPITFGMLEVGSSGLSAHHVDCETGTRWQPLALMPT